MNPTDNRIRYVLLLALPAVYTAMLLFFAVEWLCYGQTALKDIVIGGFTFLAGATAAIVGHYTGVQTTQAAVQAGVQLVRHNPPTPPQEPPQSPPPA